MYKLIMIFELRIMITQFDNLIIFNSQLNKKAKNQYQLEGWKPTTDN